MPRWAEALFWALVSGVAAVVLPYAVGRMLEAIVALVLKLRRG